MPRENGLSNCHSVKHTDVNTRGDERPRKQRKSKAEITETNVHGKRLPGNGAVVPLLRLKAVSLKSLVTWLNVAGGLSKSVLCFQARRARLAAILMLAIGVIKRPSFALRAAMAIMPTLTQRSIFYGVRTCSVEACGGTPRKRPVEAGTIRSAA